MIILDFDGTIVPSSKREMICRHFLKKIGFSRPPRAFLAMGEIFDFFRLLFSRKTKKGLNNLVEIIQTKKFSIGILTDRSAFSLFLYLKHLGIEKESLVFIQTRKSLFDFFLFEKGLFVSKETKPSKMVFEENLIPFLDSLCLEREKTLIVDDLLSVREVAKNLGFQTKDPADLP